MRRHLVILAVLCLGLAIAAPHGSKGSSSNSKESSESDSSESHEQEGGNSTVTGSELPAQNGTEMDKNETDSAARAKREDFWNSAQNTLSNAGSSLAQGANQLYSSNIQPAMQQLGQTAQNWGQTAQQGAQQLGQQAQQWGQQAGNAVSDTWGNVKNDVNQGAQQVQTAWNNMGQTSGQMNIMPYTGSPQQMSNQAQNEYSKMMSGSQGQLTMVSESPKNLWDKFLDVFKG